MRAAIVSLILFTGVLHTAVAQPFTGLHATPNSILEIRDNPAFTVHQDRAQYNLMMVGGQVGGNSLIFKNGAYNFLTGKDIAMDKDYFRSYNPNTKKFWGDVEIMGPGASLVFQGKHSFAVTTALRYMVNSDGLNDGVYRLLGVNPLKDSTTNGAHNVSNYSITSHVFSEINLSYAAFLRQRDYTTLVGGATLKILNGMGAAGMGIKNLNFNTANNNDGIARSVEGGMNVAFTPYANRWAITNSPFAANNDATNNIGLGMDIGAVYYSRQNEIAFKEHGYTTRIALSITDIGSINYEASATSGSYKATGKDINYAKLTSANNESYSTQLFSAYTKDSTLISTQSTKKFRVGLPTALRGNIDLKLEDRFFVNANFLINLRKPSPDKYATHYITTITISPRYVYRSIGISLPFSYNAEKQGFLGAMLYAGPVYIGCPNLLQMAASENTTNMSAYMGACFRIKPRKQKESDMMMY